MEGRLPHTPALLSACAHRFFPIITPPAKAARDHARYYPSFSAFFAALVNFLMMRSRLSFEMWSMNSTPLT